MANRTVITPPTPGHPFDNGIYQLPSRYDLGPLAVAESELPDFCCRARGHGEGGGECRRTGMVMTLWTEHAEIVRERARMGRLRVDTRACRLGGWIEFAERRLRHTLDTFKLPECTGEGYRRFAEPVRDIETALPVCTC